MSEETEFAPLSVERLEALSDPARNGALVVAMAREILALRKAAMYECEGRK